jgi:hypothetical protein
MIYILFVLNSKQAKLFLSGWGASCPPLRGGDRPPVGRGASFPFGQQAPQPISHYFAIGRSTPSPRPIKKSFFPHLRWGTGEEAPPHFWKGQGGNQKKQSFFLSNQIFLGERWFIKVLFFSTCFLGPF